MKIKIPLIILLLTGFMFSKSMSMQNNGPQKKIMQRKTVTLEHNHCNFHVEYETYKDLACCCCLTMAMSLGLGASKFLEVFINNYQYKEN